VDDQSLANLANDLNTQYETAFKDSKPPQSANLDAAINAIYAQIPYYMKVETRTVNPFQKMDSPRSVAQELLSELPRLVMDSDLPGAKKRALLTSIGDLYRKFITRSS
jgi:hypothetical protein